MIRKSQARYFEYFPAVFGLAALCLFGVGGLLVLLRIPGKPKDSLLYLSFLFLVPFFVAFFFDKLRNGQRRWHRWAGLLIVVLAAAMASWPSQVVVIFLCLFQLFSEDPRGAIGRFKKIVALRGSGLDLWVPSQLWALWTINFELAHYDTFHIGTSIVGNAWAFILVLAVVVAWSRVATAELAPKERSQTWVRRWVAFIPLLLTLPLVDQAPACGDSCTHHWDFYIGPSLLMKGGGWLLHDVPSQYGFLSQLVIHAVSQRGAYHGLFWLLVGFFVVEAGVFCWSLSRLSRTASGAFVLGLLAVTLTIIDPAYPSQPTSFPSIGPFRFFWVLSLMVLTWEVTRGFVKSPFRAVPRWAYILGSALWILGCLWSIESAVYCSMTWLPAFATWIWLERRPFSAKAVRLLGPVLGLGGIWFGIELWYRLRLGAGPDWKAYAEYALAYAGGKFGTIDADRNGPVWVPALLEVMLLLVAIRVWIEKKYELLPVCLAAFLGLWSTASYFAARSHPHNLVNLLPVSALGWAIVIDLTSAYWKPDFLRVWRYAGPFLIVPIVFALTDPKFPAFYGTSVAQCGAPHTEEALETLRSRNESDAYGDLLKTARVSESDSLIGLGMVLPSIGGALSRPWLPVAPYPEFSILPSARRREYLERWYRHGLAEGGGFLLFPRGADAEVPELIGFLNAFFRRSLRIDNGNWILEKWVPGV